MRNREFVFTPKIEYKLVAERSEANQNSLTFSFLVPSADRLQVSPRRRSANSQTAPRGFACWQNIAAGFDSRAKPRRWLLSDIFASLKCPRQIVYKFRLAAARRTRRPPLAVLPAGKTSLRASIPARSHAGGFSPDIFASLKCPRQESNLRRKLRKLASYPLNDEGVIMILVLF